MSRAVTGFHTPELAAFIKADAYRQLNFFRSSLQADGGLATLDYEGNPVDGPQELITTTRLVHSYALGKLAGVPGCDDIIDAGMKALWENHRDTDYGGYVWSFDDAGAVSTDKLAYGHMFTLLAGASAKAVGHPNADRLIKDVDAVIAAHFWDNEAGLSRDEFRRDWTPFSNYRGMNANMHGVEAHLSAYEITGDTQFLSRAQSILSFFISKMAANNDWRLPEHYREDWSVDQDYEGNPMFRPAGTTPGHSFELGRLNLQAWDLEGRPENSALADARSLIYRALEDAWDEKGGFVYTLNFDGSQRVKDRYWWPVTEAIGAVATLLKVDPTEADREWYARLWDIADKLFIDRTAGGWFPELDANNQPTDRQFAGKPDIYHALQADLYPLHPDLSRHYDGVKGVLES